MDIEIALNVTTAILFMGILGLLLSSMLVFANKKLWVFEDPRIDELENMLPATNCGACGNAGCRPFAEALISGEVSPAQCTVSNAEDIEKIADYLGVESGDVIKRVARLACAGGNHVARTRARYKGLETCRAAAVVSGGPKSCTWGCIGLADCADVCDFDAITMNHYGLPMVDAARCTACGDCVDVCPKDLFSIHDISHRLWVACKNLESGDNAENDCEVACTACERCVKDSPEGLVTIQDNLAVIDYNKISLASPIATERCPTGAIVWLDDTMGVIKGHQAKRIVRKEALPI
jgi:RnfABCDGE-type electron transport complex B subunit